MSKLAGILLILATAALFWHQTEAKPFLLLPANFFVLTTRAPPSDSGSSSTSYSSSSTYSTSGGLLQLPANIISRKLNFIANLFSGFGTTGSVGGSFGLGFKFNAAVTTRKPKTTTRGTTEPVTIFTPEVTTQSSETTSYTSSTTAKSSVATSTEKSVINTLTEAIASSTTEAAAINVQTTVGAQVSAIITTTKNNIAYDASTTESTNENDGIVNTNSIGGNLEVITAVDKNTIQTGQVAVGGISSLAIDTALQSVGGVISSGANGGGYEYETLRPNIENEILSGNVQNTYLPAQK